MKQTGLDVICVGAAIVDIPLYPVSKNIFDCESYPLEQISMTIGGDAINEATILSTLGKNVELISLVGNDVIGNFIINHCKNKNIDISNLKIRNDINTSINIGLVTEDGERTFVTNRNGSLWKMTINDINLNCLTGAKILSFASIFNNPKLDNKAMVKIFRKAKQSNMIICADMIKPRLNETFDDISQALSYVDYFFPNQEEAQLMTGEINIEKIAEKILSYGVKNVIIKTRKEGCYIKNSKEAFSIPIYKGIKALDTIGAGDNFAAGFITALSEGKTIRECGEYANVTASIAIQSIGATTGIKNKKMVDERLIEYYKQYL
ncbi:MAG: carbohydrate kinase family protein [Pleomorphochaeta sp.]